MKKILKIIKKELCTYKFTEDAKEGQFKKGKGNLFNFYHIYLSCHKYVKSRDDMPKKNWFNK